MAELIRIRPRKRSVIEKKKVAAYARVSTAREQQEHSFAAQVSYYSELIQNNPEWEYVGVYSDDGVTGTSVKKRMGFQEMMADAEAGKIDIILVKSISRFARNTVDLLESVRHLKELGIEVRFEKENISSLSADGELMLTILASFAQEEVESMSRNIKWAKRKRYEQGLPHAKFNTFGYRWNGDTLVPEPYEAEIVKLAFENYLKGISPDRTAKQLAKEGKCNQDGTPITKYLLRNILSNYTYTGNMVLQKYYIEDPVSHRQRKNEGELPKYIVEHSHEAIISEEMFQKVQDEIMRRRDEGFASIPGTNTTCFTSRIKCGCCGRSYTRTICKRKDPTDRYYIWRCSTKNRKTSAACQSKSIPENTLKKVCATVMGTEVFDEKLFAETVESIVVIGDENLEFHFRDGSVRKTEWHSTAPKDSWTDERRKRKSRAYSSRKDNPLKRNWSELSALLKCGRCGGNYTSVCYDTKHGRVRRWRCSNNGRCHNCTFSDEEMKDMICDVLGTVSFDQEEMDRRLEKAVVDGDEVTFFFYDGHTQKRRIGGRQCQM